MRSFERRATRILWLPILLLGAAAAVAAPGGTERLPAEPLSWERVSRLPDGAGLLDRELERRQVFHERWHRVHDLLGERHVSKRAQRWLVDQGLGPARLRAPVDAAAKAGVDTLRILLVRIAFAENRAPELVTMAPDGDFFYEPRYPDDVLQIDPEPHDKAFFESHLEGLSEYYGFQSGGRLHIDARVLPEGDRDAYLLSDPADYGPGAGNFWTIEGLERMVRDMITAADEGTQADGSADLGDYDDDNPLTYIIFAHAGSDWQSDVLQDTPNDIPTFFVTLGEAQELTNGSLTECSVIPETTTQDGYKGSIAAALYHEFGHALGLPDVYDATTGYTSVGVWDLMDSGTNLAAVLGYLDENGEVVAEAVTGVLPPSLSAWCKWFLGWVSVGEITGGEGREHKLPAVGVPPDRYSLHNTVAGNDFRLEDPQVLAGGASPGEFFLLENRWVPLGVQDTPYDPVDGDYGGLYLLTDSTGVILYLAGDRRGTTGINTGYYDYFLPEGGVLVWHANMDRIEAGLATNSINAYGDGLKLVEADGIPDVGVLEPYVWGWYGGPRDPFAPWNEVGYDELFVEGAGVPNSRAHDRSWTGLRLWDIDDDGSAHGAVMRLQAAVEPLRPGWPVTLPPAGDQDTPQPRALDPTSLTPARDGTRPLVLAVDEPPAGAAPVLFAWDTVGAPAYAPVGELPEGGVLELSDRLVGPPAVVTYSDGTEVVLVATVDGTLQALTVDGGGLAPLYAIDAADSLVAGPQPVPMPGGEILTCLVDGDGWAQLYDESGLAFGQPIRIFDHLDDAEFISPLRVMATADYTKLLFVTDRRIRYNRVVDHGFDGNHTGSELVLEGPAPLALLPSPDGDGEVLLIFGPEGLQFDAHFPAGGGIRGFDWPDPGGAVVCEPAVADLDNDGRLDVVAATAERIFAWQGNGATLTGYPGAVTNLFPLPDSPRVAGPLVVADLAGGPGNELAFATAAGHLFVLDGRGLPVTGTPFRFGDGPAGLAIVPTAGDRATLPLAVEAGRSGPPLDRRLTHGRVAMYGERVLPGGEPATAGWFGPGGGPERSGWVGTPQAVAGESPADDPARAAAVYYPNPVTGSELTVRFWSATDQPAELVIFNLQGEPVLRRQLPAEAERLNEFTVDLDVASGLYLARLTSEKTAGRMETEVNTVAVAR